MFFYTKILEGSSTKKRNKLNDWQRLQKFVTVHNISIPILPEGDLQTKLDFLEKLFLSSCRKPPRYYLQSSEIITKLKVLPMLNEAPPYNKWACPDSIYFSIINSHLQNKYIFQTAPEVFPINFVPNSPNDF